MTRILPKNYRLVPKGAKKVFHGTIFDIYQWKQEMYDGSTAVFEMAKRVDTVQVLAIDDTNLIAVNEQQPDGTTRSYGLPGGRIDPEDTNPLAAAKREMLEETGYSFKNWKLLNVRQPQQKIEWFVYLFVAWEITAHELQKTDVGEKIEVLKTDWPTYLQKGNQLTIFENNLKQYSAITDIILAKEFD